MNRRLLVAALAATTCALTAACGSSGGGGGGGTINMLVTYPANNLIQDFPEIKDAAQAAAKAINKSGGIDGHKINMLSCNDKDDANDSQNCARMAVQNRVVSVVGQADLYSNQSLPILKSAGIPSVGLYTVGVPQDATSSNSFLLNAGSVGSIMGFPYALKPKNVTVVAQAVADVPVALAQAKLPVPQLASQGVTTKGVTTIPLTNVTDFSPYAQKLKATGAQAILCTIPTPVVNGMIKATSAIGYNPLFLINSQTYGEADAAQSPAAQSRLVITSPYASPRDTSDPLIGQFVKESAAAQGKSASAYLASTKFGSGWSNAVDAWLSVHAVAKALAKSGDVTASGLMKVLTKKGTDIDLYGQSWQPAYTSSATFYPRINKLTIHYLTIKNGKLAALEGLSPVDLRSRLG